MTGGFKFVSSGLAVSGYVVVVAVRALDVVDHPTLWHFVCLVFRVHQQEPQGVDARNKLLTYFKA